MTEEHPQQHSPPTHQDPLEDPIAFAVACARCLRDDKCEDIVALDVRGMSEVTDVVIVASGTSDRQMNSALDDVQELAEDSGRAVFRTSKDERSTWLLADFVDVVVHVFEPSTRAYYDIEMLWGDANRLQWRRPGPLDQDANTSDADEQAPDAAREEPKA